jgi:hypothetical protein
VAAVGSVRGTSPSGGGQTIRWQLTPICNFHFAIFNLQYFPAKVEVTCLAKLLKNENCKLKIAN